MIGSFVASLLLASVVRGLQLTNNRLAQELGACPDVSGSYEDKKGKDLTIAQSGCDVRIKMWWDAQTGEVHKTGKVEGATLEVHGFNKPGSLTTDGDVYFGDGGHWKKKHTQATSQLKAVSSPGARDEMASALVPAAASANRNEALGQKTQAITTEARDKKEVQKVAGGCSDIHGSYIDKKGKPLTVYQNGCFIKVRMYWDLQSKVIIPGYIGTNDLHVKDFKKPGIFSEGGDIIFEDGGLWKRVANVHVASESPIAKSSELSANAATDLPSLEGLSVQHSPDFTDESANAQVAQTNASALGPPASEPQTATDSIATKVEDSSEGAENPSTLACKDVGGVYVDKLGQSVTIEQTGCTIVVTSHDTALSGTIDDQLHLGQQSSPGFISTSGDIFFSDGALWKRTQAEMDSFDNKDPSAATNVSQNGSEMSNVNESVTTGLNTSSEMTSGSSQDDPCPDVKGKYKSDEGHDVTVFQIGCFVKVKMVKPGQESVLKSGRINNKQLEVKDFIHPGLMTETGDIFFDDGHMWKKAVTNTPSNALDTQNASMEVIPAELANADDQAYPSPTTPQTQATSLDVEDTTLEGNTSNVSNASNDELIEANTSNASNASNATVFENGTDEAREVIEGEDEVVPDLTQTGDMVPADDEGGAEALDHSKADDFATSPCNDIHGSYTDNGGKTVSIDQVGCDVMVKLSTGSEDVQLGGKLAGEVVKIQNFEHAGLVNPDGALFFADGTMWTKKDATADSSYQTHLAVTADAAADVDAADAADAAASEAPFRAPNEAIVNVALANLTGNFSGSVTAANESNTTFTNASEANISLNATLSSTSSVVETADDEDEEEILVDEHCPDVTGTYENMQGAEAKEVTVYQIGCFVKVKLYWDEELGEVLKSGKIKGNFMYIDDLQAPGIMTLSGDILFGNGGDWKKKHSGEGNKTMSSSNQTSETSAQENSSNQSASGSFWNASSNGSDNSSVNTSWNVSSTGNAPTSAAANALQTLLSTGSVGALLDLADIDSVQRGVQDQCPDIHGHYFTSIGKLVTVEQSECHVDVQLWWDNEHGEVLTKGSVSDAEVRIDGFLETGSIREESIQFPAGAVWRKLSDTELATVKKDGCSDVSGMYGDRTGNVVTITQTGCHAAVGVVGHSPSTKSKLGHVIENELHLFDHSSPGRRTRDGSLDFGASTYWGKLTDQQAAEAASDSCSSAAGHYRDGRGEIATVSQDKCHIAIQMLWDSETGNVTLGGYMFGDLVHVKEFHSSGSVNQTEHGSVINFMDGAVWHQMSNEEAIALSLPEAGCQTFDGVYVDTNGKQAVVTQTGCHMEVNMYWNDVLGNVKVEGHVSRGTMHLRGLDDGEKSEFGISFGEDKHWTKIGGAR